MQRSRKLRRLFIISLYIFRRHRLSGKVSATQLECNPVGCFIPPTEWIALLGQEPSPQQPWQKANFRFRPATTKINFQKNLF